MPVRKASAVWEGSLKEGKGVMKMEGGYEGPYSFGSRFEEGKGTNPEELIGAAHAGCFSMALANELTQAGHTPRRVQTTARVTIAKEEGGFRITGIELDTDVSAPGIDKNEFTRIAEHAKANCPVSRALAGTQITLKAHLSA